MATDDGSGGPVRMRSQCPVEQPLVYAPISQQADLPAVGEGTPQRRVVGRECAGLEVPIGTAVACDLGTFRVTRR